VEKFETEEEEEHGWNLEVERNKGDGAEDRYDRRIALDYNGKRVGKENISGSLRRMEATYSL